MGAWPVTERQEKTVKRHATVLGALACALAFGSAAAAPDAAQGKRLLAEHQCDACHAKKMGGDAAAIYLRKDRKVTSMAKLKAQVAACNSGLGLGLFPDDEEHVVAYLNQAYYKFK
jgi:hypothetical protein